MLANMMSCCSLFFLEKWKKIYTCEKFNVLANRKKVNNNYKWLNTKCWQKRKSFCQVIFEKNGNKQICGTNWQTNE